jgi:transposase
MDGVVELVTGRERRRRWSIEDKLRLVAETHEPGAGVRSVAVQHGVCESLLFTWRRQVSDGVLVAPEMPMFMLVQMVGAGGTNLGLSHREPRGAPPSPSVRPHPGLIEIDLGNGSQLRVGSDVNLAALRRVLVALRG